MAKSASARLIAAVLAVGFWVMFLSSAIKGLYQVYFVDLSAHFGGSRSDMALAGSLFVLSIGLLSPVVGALSDRCGPLWTVAFGSFCAGVMLLGVSYWPHSQLLFVLLYGLLGAFALTAMSFVPMGILVDRMVQSRSKALAFAVVSNGTAIGFIVLSPLWIWLQQWLAWPVLFNRVGWLFLLPLTLALSWVAWRVPLLAQAEPTPAPGVLWQLGKDPRLYWLALSFFSCGASMAFIDVHLLPYWQGNGVPPSVQASGLSLLGVLELGSGLLAGWLATRFNKAGLLAGFYLLRCAAVLVLLASPTPYKVYLFALLFGASYLGTVVLTSAFCFDLFGARNKGQVFGLLFLVHQLGALTLTQLAALDFDRHQNYQLSISLLAGLTLAAAGFALCMLPSARGVAKRVEQ
ncbi:MFS transporter [Pseudomonas sp. 5P_3.1_Bac2]|uniref:MFS transporter n=1 Tax=Pseudomonas sp. 5P_3.1_Bac2 TaxID=2971617 RepID=UPI0021C87D65|nr:MFS transporter [Pseudomonas sp. 5P_3.1_Bac2]MCU1719619.1 MFS transporter [Pseudomonas sp. 5P_3.1_Bac2]